MTETGQRQFACNGCGAAIEFAPGTASMRCPYCGAQTSIETRESAKNDYAEYASRPHAPLGDIPPFTVACNNCGTSATTTAISARCASCKAALVVTENATGELKAPDGIVPFVVDKERAGKEFREWSSSRWFAPNALKKVVKADNMAGGYLPHWGFDDKTTTDYTGQRGEHYWETETYTDIGPKGEMVQRTRQVQKTRWYPAAGRVARDFVDVISPGVTSPSPDLLEKLGPWSTDQASGFRTEFLAGFDTPRYTVPAEAGFTAAQQQMAEQIEHDCRRDIGGDEQRVHSMSTIDSDVLFRLLLMPLWLATYVFAGTTYHVYVNANTGEVIGERPYSWLKISLAVVALIAVAVALFVAFKTSGGSG